MGFPDPVRVKLSSEDAGAINLTPVVMRDMPARELIEFIVAAAGKRTGRVREILRNGSLVSGASRLRWQGWEAEDADIVRLLATFPDPDPSRPFVASGCVHAVLFGPFARIELARAAAQRRRLFRRASFWDRLLEVARAGETRYQDYSYRDRADLYRLSLNSEQAAAIRAAARLLPYAALARQIETAAFDSVDLYVQRPT
jgi:hypothetical protein